MKKIFHHVSKEKKIFIIVIFGTAMLALLYFIQIKNYLLFHSIAEIFSIIIACSLFILAWNCQKYFKHNKLAFLGVAYLFIGILDLLHTLSYKGMSIFKDYDYYANQLWIATRYLESLSFLIFSLVKLRKRSISIWIVLIIYTLLTGIIIWSIFISKIFPVCFIEGQGQTSFKIISEYIISAILFASLILIILRKKDFHPVVYRYLIISVILTISGELAFTFYINNYSFTNFVGHLLKIGSYYCIYKAIIERGIRSPNDLIFRQLSLSEANLAKANRTKDKFLSIIAHDLKNPIGGMYQLLKVLKYEEKSLSEPERIEIIDALFETASKTNILLRNLLLWSRSQSSTIEIRMEKIEINSILSELKNLFKSLINTKDLKVKFNLSEPFFAYADRNMLETVFRNLISNAIKFTPRKGEIIITLTREAQWVVFTITDNGIGIAKEKIPELFKVDSQYTELGTENETGTGLGLKLCHEFVKLNKGSISVESEPEKGSTFTVKLPAAK